MAATAVSSTRIDLTWTDRSASESGYVIEQSPNGTSGWGQVGTAAANATSFSATGPFDGSTTYYFRIRANYSSGYSASVSVTTPSFPSRPTGLTATTPVEGTITLNWADATNETGYRVERSVNGTSGWTAIGAAAANATSYSDAGLPENTQFYYRVVATNGVGDSAASATVNATSPLATPGSVAASVVSGGQIDLTWTDRSSIESNYLIEQSLDGVNGWSQVGTAPANATSFFRPWPVQRIHDLLLPGSSRLLHLSRELLGILYGSVDNHVVVPIPSDRADGDDTGGGDDHPQLGRCSQ